MELAKEEMRAEGERLARKYFGKSFADAVSHLESCEDPHATIAGVELLNIKWLLDNSGPESAGTDDK